MPDPFAQLSADDRDALRPGDVPAWTDPMLAVLVDEAFSSPDWIFERKLDGERCLAFRDGDEVRLRSRNRRDLNGTYPELVEALRAQEATRFVVDGEVVAFDGGLTSFERLQGRLGIDDPDEARASGVAVRFYLFDVLHLEGRDTTALPLRTRKALLKRALAFDDPVRFTPHWNEDGERRFGEACRRGWEGLIAKRAEAPYRHARSRDWRKFTCGNRQEFVVGGWTEPQGSRVGIGALLLGTWDGDQLRYHGKVGTGFGEEQARSLRERLEGLARSQAPFADPPSEEGAHWARPDLVVEVAFREWTRAGRLRHPSFLGVRDDKPSRQVVRERPA
jgi:DNA ligase D-like protein (predicted ligase)